MFIHIEMFKDRNTFCEVYLLHDFLSVQILQLLLYTALNITAYYSLDQFS